MKEINKMNNSEVMLGNLDKVMRQLRRMPIGTHKTSRGTYRLLKKVLDTPGISTRELAELMDIRRASLNEKLLRLENEGMILRNKDSKDQRIQLVHLKESALEHMEKIKETRLEKSIAISDILSEQEIQDLSHLANKLAKGLEIFNTENKQDDLTKEEEKGETVYE